MPQSGIRGIALQSVRSLSKLLRDGAQVAEAHYLLRFALKDLYTPRPDDIFIVSYPKSGTTLMQMMLYQMTTDGEMDLPHIESFSPWFETFLTMRYERYLEALPSPRVFKSHLRYPVMPRGVKSIYLVRDVRDVAVSSFHHQCLMTGAEFNFENYARNFARGRSFCGSWYKHVETWWPHRNDPNVLFLRYEEIVKDIPGTVRRVAAFCNLPLKEEDMPRIVERCSVSFMKQHNEKFDPRLRKLSPIERAFVRKGIPGEGRTTLAPAEAEEMSRQLTALAQKLGCMPNDPYSELLLAD